MYLYFTHLDAELQAIKYVRKVRAAFLSTIVATYIDFKNQRGATSFREAVARSVIIFFTSKRVA